MTDCKGIFGKWFGHKFKSFLVKQRSLLPIWTEVTINNDGISTHQDNDANRDIYIIRCKRCGAKLDGN